MRVFDDVPAFCAAVGEHLGDSAWVEIDQGRINLFADATGDHQWIHVDAERAAAGPFGSTIAHGFLTLSLVPVLMNEVFEVRNVALFMNYGSNKVRFLRPVPVGSRVQASVTLSGIEQAELGVRATLHIEVRLGDGGKPACVAEMITLIVPA
ncbi:MAG: MaoC family dehydratase [Actinomycetota bacterium]|nr:MaoC family dehydratase [Actinomycetota bacterium]